LFIPLNTKVSAYIEAPMTQCLQNVIVKVLILSTACAPVTCRKEVSYLRIFLLINILYDK